MNSVLPSAPPKLFTRIHVTSYTPAGRPPNFFKIQSTALYTFSPSQLSSQNTVYSSVGWRNSDSSCPIVLCNYYRWLIIDVRRGAFILCVYIILAMEWVYFSSVSTKRAFDEIDLHWAFVNIYSFGLYVLKAGGRESLESIIVMCALSFRAAKLLPCWWAHISTFVTVCCLLRLLLSICKYLFFWPKAGGRVCCASELKLRPNKLLAGGPVTVAVS